MSAAEWIASRRSATTFAHVALDSALDALEAVLAFATAERDKIRSTYVLQPDTAYAGYANAMDDVIRTIESALTDERSDQWGFGTRPQIQVTITNPPEPQRVPIVLPCRRCGYQP